MIRFISSCPRSHRLLWILGLSVLCGVFWAWFFFNFGGDLSISLAWFFCILTLLFLGMAGYEVHRQLEQKNSLVEMGLELQGVLERLPLGVAIADGNGRVTWINDKGLEILGMPRDAVTMLNWLHPELLMLYPDGGLMEPLERPLNKAIATRAPVKDVVMGLEQPESGVWVWANFSAEPRLDAQGAVVQVLLTFEDVTQKHKAMTELVIQSFRDQLTSLPNRALFMERLAQALLRIGRNRLSAAVLFMDLDRFKVINESLGHSSGDQLLVQVSKRLRGCIRPEDSVARLGGDDFVLLLEDLGGNNDVLTVAERVAKALESPFVLQGRELHTTCSMGIALTSDAHCSPADLLRDAEVAMYRAKSKGEGSIELFDPSMNEQAMRRFQMEAELRRAIEQREFVLYYQPLISLKSGRIEGWEALVRWMHPEKGLVPPVDFISLAEETGLIVPIGKWVVEEATHQASLWAKGFPSDVPRQMNVNISGRQFQHRDLVSTVTDALALSKLSPGCLKLEITESVMMKDPQASLEAMKVLRGLDIHLVIDDFGTGYSSLSYLRRFPVDTLKVDKSFVDGLGKDAESTAIVRAIISLAKSLGMRVTAEGIETADQVVQLRQLDCDQGQGHYFAKPLSVSDAEVLMDGNPSW